MSDSISNIKVFPVNKGAVKANGSFTVGGMVAVRFAIIDSKNGLFVALPRRQYTDKETGETKWADEVNFVSKQAMEQVTQQILAEWNSRNSGTDTNSQSTGNATGTDDLPF